jgi:hypothetical protein
MSIDLYTRDLEVFEKFNEVCDRFKPSEIYANLMPKCGTMYTRAGLSRAGIWPQKSVSWSSIRDSLFKSTNKISNTATNRGDHFVCANKVKGFVPDDRGWSKNQLEVRPSRQKKLWFTVSRNPFNLLVSYYTFGWPWHRGHGLHAVNEKNSIYKSFDYYIKSYCDPDYPWVVPAHKNFLFFPIFDDEGNCRAPIVFRLEYIDFCLNKLCDNFSKTYRPPKLTRSSRPKDKNRHEWKSYYNEDLFDLVSKKCKRELEIFGYNFDGIEKRDKRKIIDLSNINYNIDTDKVSINEYNSELIFDMLRLTN